MYRRQIEADWLKQADVRQREPISTQTDARGACDGIKNGKYGFHTAEERSPWWQVDLGASIPISRLVLFNRLDYAPGLHNADHLRVLVSDDARGWTSVRENNAHFGGVGGKPLQIAFKTGEVRGRFVRLQVLSDRPLYFHLDEVEVYDAAGRNVALHRPADQSSLSPWSTVKPLLASGAGNYPIAEWINRGRQLVTALRAKPAEPRAAEASSFEQELNRLAQKLSTLPKGAGDQERRNLYFQTRWQVRRMVFSNPLLNFDRLLFVKRFTQESYPDVCLNHMPWVSRPGGDLCVFSSASAGNLVKDLAAPANASLKLHNVLNGALGPGHVHGMDLSWDGKRIVFGFARTRDDQPPAGWLDRSQSYHLRRTEEPIHIFEIGVDGKNLRQVTAGEWSDLDPTYAPNGDIVFVSERCGTSLQCNEYDKDETSCNLYVMHADGAGIRRMSANKDGDYLPHALDDGTIAYTRWEYHERSWALIQSIWTIRPDGTGADAVFKQHFANPWSLEDTRSIPGSKKLVAIAAGHHTLAAGPLVVVTPEAGINEVRGLSIVTPGVQPPEGTMDGVPVKEGGVRDGGGFYSTPIALSEQCFLVSYSYGSEETDAAGYGIYLVDVFGNKELVYRDPTISCFIPTPLRARPRPTILPDNAHPGKDLATCVLSDVGFGSEEVAGKIRYLRIAEPIGWPYDNHLGGQRYGEKGAHLVNWTPIRILGDVPVESDGSAQFQVPADRAVYFQLLDENRMELRRMRSFISFQPGEVRSCVGCHETRGVSLPAEHASLAALHGPAEMIAPPWGDRPVSFLRDIQPVLDRNCVGCHSGLKPAAGLDFSSGLTDWSGGQIPGYGFNRAFETITRAKLVATAEPNLQDASITPPFAYGSHKSKLIATLDHKPHHTDVHLTADERLRLVMWVDANAPYHDTFVNKRAAAEAYDFACDPELKRSITAIHSRRCAACHKAEEISRLDWIDFRQPQRSLFLSAPLAKEWGGTRRCREDVYRNTDDADYREMRDLIETAVERARKSPRRDLRACLESQSDHREASKHSSELTAQK